MFSCASKISTILVVYCIFVFTVNTITATSIRRYEMESSLDYNARSEAGFDLDEEDITKFHIWTDEVIPYYIDDLSYDKVLRDRIRIYLSALNRLTALHFNEIPSPPEDNDTRWVFFVNRKGLLGCADHPFKKFTNQGVQKVVLGYHCMYSDQNLADVILSLVGVPPQHNSPDRDEYVQIKKDNIIPDKVYLFDKLKDNEWLFHNLTYDIHSSGHYGPYKHTLNGKVTIQEKDDNNFLSDPQPPYPKEIGLSPQDILKIAMLYNYILRNRQKPAPECSKLFVSGDKISNFMPSKNNDVQPREKPNQYQVLKEVDINNNVTTAIEDTEKIDSVEFIEKTESIIISSIENKDNSKKVIENNILNVNVGEEYPGKGDKEGSGENYNKEEYQTKINIYDKSTTFGDIVDNKEDDKEKISEKDNMNNNSKNDEHKNLGKKNIEKDREGESSNKNKKFEYDTTPGGIATKNHRVLMTRKVKKGNQSHKVLLGQSDYETGDEGKNRYIHETK